MSNSKRATAADLLAKRIKEEEIPLPGLDVTVVVRGLSREESAALSAAEGPDAAEIMALRFGLIDPKLTEDEIREWRRQAPGGELQPIAEAITRLSGMDDGADRRVVEEFRADPSAEFRALPSGEAGSNGGGAADRPAGAAL